MIMKWCEYCGKPLVKKGSKKGYNVNRKTCSVRCRGAKNRLMKTHKLIEEFSCDSRKEANAVVKELYGTSDYRCVKQYGDGYNVWKVK